MGRDRATATLTRRAVSESLDDSHRARSSLWGCETAAPHRRRECGNSAAFITHHDHCSCLGLPRQSAPPRLRLERHRQSDRQAQRCRCRNRRDGPHRPGTGRLGRRTFAGESLPGSLRDRQLQRRTRQRHPFSGRNPRADHCSSASGSQAMPSTVTQPWTSATGSRAKLIKKESDRRSAPPRPAQPVELVLRAP